MPLTVYEKNHVKPNMEAVVLGKVTFNVLNKPRTQKPNEYVTNPKPEYVIALNEPKFVKGDKELVSALKETLYGDQKDKISFSDKSPFAPTIFGKDNDKLTGEQLIPEGQALKNGQPVLVHVKTFQGHGNVGCGFDAIKLSVPLKEAEVVTTGGSVKADVFEL